AAAQPLPQLRARRTQHDATRGMEEDAPVKRSVAELAGKFKNAASTPDTEQGPTSKPIRRRPPPRSLQIPPHTPVEPERADGAISPFAARPKRNSALIEKLQANLLLSPTALLPSPKSPGFMLIGPSFAPPSPSPTPGHNTSSLTSVAVATPVTPTSPLPLLSPQSEEEVPASFEIPASAAEGAVLPSINKSRARLSIKRRPPSRRNRVSSSGEEEGGVSPNTEDPPLLAPSSEAKGGRSQRVEEKEKEQLRVSRRCLIQSPLARGSTAPRRHRGPRITWRPNPHAHNLGPRHSLRPPTALSPMEEQEEEEEEEEEVSLRGIQTSVYQWERRRRERAGAGTGRKCPVHT
ncbi:hypothetical protein CRUP_017633, partial [Coryphaenoides rupestris]